MFVDEKTIAELNEKFMGKSGPTDVLSFPIDDGPPDSGRVPDGGSSGPGDTGEPEETVSLLGDVVICPKVAHERAADHAGTYEDELALLLVHGLLHLLGMDHDEDEEAVVMEARERELLQEYWRDLPGTAWASTHPDMQQKDE
jgi:probable rRNA maturation factor